MFRDPADDSEHICAELGALQPVCDGYYCRVERELIAEAEALRGGETALSADDQLTADASRIIDFELGENADYWRARRGASAGRVEA